jgi:diguanylate cyclase (GGDEF)-like protein
MAQAQPHAQPTAAQSQQIAPAALATQMTPQPEVQSRANGATARDSKDHQAGRVRKTVSRKFAWGLLAASCVAAGAVGSVLGAHAVASSDAKNARRASQQTSAAIASTVKLALQREEELRVSASTYYAGNSATTPSEFARWAKWAQMLRRYPELDQLGLITLVHASGLPAFETHVTGKKAPANPANATIHVTPAGARPFYCLAVANLVRDAAGSPPSGLDYCVARGGLLAARDSGLSHYAVVGPAGAQALEVINPVYKGEQPPASLGARIGAFAGWMREVLDPSVVLEEALRGHEGGAARLSFDGAAGPVSYSAGSATAGAPSTTAVVRGGWTVEGVGTTVSTGTLADGSALALLVVGCVLSVLLGVLVFLLGAGRGTARVREPKSPVGPSEDLHDPLTGLPNRALMLDRAECMLARAGRQSGLLVGALFIDIDWFEDVNDRLGRAAGDQILKIVAQRLEGVVRAGDTVGRLGSDEFVLLVESAARGARLDSLARRVVEALHKPFDLDDFGPNFFLTASIGVAFGRYATPDDLLRDAQLALYAAKSAGKDRYTLFNANMRSVIEGRGVLEVELNTALNEKQFFLLYEPIYDLGTGRVAGLEALVRWLHPKRGVVLPEDFVPLAEETGLSVPIGRWMLEEACARAAAWNVAGHRVGVAVPVSANQLNREGFITDVRRALQQSGIEPQMLTLEIEETTVMREVSVAVEQLQELKNLGVRIAIDDFGGSGYAYHSDLRRLPLDFLKVDRSSLAASEDEDYRTWLLEAILIVGRDLSLTVIAKGIESFEQVSALQSMGCTMAQGALMGKAVPANAIENVLGSSLPMVRAESAPSE